RGRGAGEQVRAEEEARAARGEASEGPELAAARRPAARERERRRVPAAAEEDAGAAVAQAGDEGDALAEEGEVPEAREARVVAGALPGARDRLEGTGRRVEHEQRGRYGAAAQRRAENDGVRGGREAAVAQVEDAALWSGLTGGDDLARARLAHPRDHLVPVGVEGGEDRRLAPERATAEGGDGAEPRDLVAFLRDQPRPALREEVERLARHAEGDGAGAVDAGQGRREPAAEGRRARPAGDAPHAAARVVRDAPVVQPRDLAAVAEARREAPLRPVVGGEHAQHAAGGEHDLHPAREHAEERDLADGVQPDEPRPDAGECLGTDQVTDLGDGSRRATREVADEHAGGGRAGERGNEGELPVVDRHAVLPIERAVGPAGDRARAPLLGRDRQAQGGVPGVDATRPAPHRGRE